MSVVFKCDRCGAIQIPEVSKQGPHTRGHARVTEFDSFEDVNRVESRDYDLCQECTMALIPWLYRAELA